MNCEYCGTRLFESDRECPRCGGKIVETNAKTYSEINNQHKELCEEILAIVVAGGDVSLFLGNKKQLRVYGIIHSASPFILSNDLLEFIPEKNNIIYVSPSDGTIYGNKKGYTGLRIIYREKPILESIIRVDVV